MSPSSTRTIEEHFKYGSTGGERESGFPYWIFQALPEVCAEHLPGQGYASLGLIFEDGQGPAGRHVEAPLPGHRPHVPQLRRLPREHGARHAGARSRALVPRHAGEHLRPHGRSRNSSSTARRIRSSPPSTSCRRSTGSCGHGEDLELLDRYRRLSGRDRADARAAADAARAASRSLMHAAGVGSGPRRHLQLGQGALQLSDRTAAGAEKNRRRRTFRRSGCRSRARACSCTGTATTRWSRSATRARPSAPARRRRRSTSRAIGAHRGVAARRASRRSIRTRSTRRKAAARRADLQASTAPAAMARAAATSPGEYVGQGHAASSDIGTDRRRLDSYTLRPRGEPGDALRGLPVALPALPQDLRLRQHAARRHLAARAVPAQRLGADAARPARAGGDAAEACSTAATTSTTRRSVGFVSDVPRTRAAESTSGSTRAMPRQRQRRPRGQGLRHRARRRATRTRWSST